jgi:cyclic pyranopterin phosphate synthase
MDQIKSIKMSDISKKKISHRSASAICEVEVTKEILVKILNNELPKGDVIATAKIAGILAVKKTDELIPLCHSIPISNAIIDIIVPTEDSNNFIILIKSFVESDAQTGVEMEALAAVTVAGLTIYDMTKSYSHSINLKNIRLLEKKGGKSGDFTAETSD